MPLLDITRLKKTFLAPDGSQHTVINVKSFSLADGAHVALAGESGSGKTTLLHLIAGILKPDTGSVIIAGQEMSALSESQRDRLRATTIGYIFQTFNLLQGYTCLENVLLGMSFGPGADRMFARELLERVGLGNLDHKNATEALSLIRTACHENGAALLLVSHDREVLAQFETVQELERINQTEMPEEKKS